MNKKVQFKVSLLGEGMVGKTSLKNRIITGKFTDLYLTTLGVDFGIHNLKIENYDVQLAIWDIAGQKNFSAIREGYFDGSTGAIIVFDVTRPETLTKIKENWIVPFFKKLGGKLPVLILGNKIDLTNERNLTQKQIEDFLKLMKAELNLPETSLPYIEASVKDGINITKAIEEFSRILVQFKQDKDKITGKVNIY